MILRRSMKQRACKCGTTTRQREANSGQTRGLDEQTRGPTRSADCMAYHTAPIMLSIKPSTLGALYKKSGNAIAPTTVCGLEYRTSCSVAYSDVGREPLQMKPTNRTRCKVGGEQMPAACHVVTIRLPPIELFTSACCGVEMYAGRAQQNAHHEHIFEVAGDAGHQRLIHLCAQEGGVIYRQP